MNGLSIIYGANQLVYNGEDFFAHFFSEWNENDLKPSQMLSLQASDMKCNKFLVYQKLYLLLDSFINKKYLLEKQMSSICKQVS